MNLPIQAAPIDRANRAESAQAAIKGSAIVPALDLGVLCPLCDLLPAPVNAICKMICGKIT